MTYECETWTLNNKMPHKVQCTKRSIECCTLGIMTIYNIRSGICR